MSSPTIALSVNDVTVRFPKINAKCSATYFSTTAAAEVDQDNSYYEITVRLYRVIKWTSPNGATVKNVIDMWQNGF